MAYASKEGRARINSRSPQAAGQCDRCGFLYSHSHLRWQLDYSGSGLYNKRILVCENCYDTPQQQLKVIVIPPDPMPILNARPPDYENSVTNIRQTYQTPLTDPVTGLPIPQGDTRVSNAKLYLDNELLMENLSGCIQLENRALCLSAENSAQEEYVRVTQQTGEPPGGLNEFPGTNFQVPGNDDPGLPYGNEEVPQTGPL